MSTAKELKTEAKLQRIKNYSRMRKCQLEEVLTDKSALSKIQKEVKIIYNCKHGRNKHMCKDCGGKNFCEHNKQRYQCRDCGGKGFCKHNKTKHQCSLCHIVKKLIDI